MTRFVLVANTDWYLFNHRLSLAATIRGLGGEPHLASPDGPFRARLVDAGFVWHEIPVDRMGYNPAKEAGTLAALERLYARVRPTVVHHFTVKPVIYGSIAARRTAVPCVVNSITGRGYVFVGRGIWPRVLRAVVRPVYAYALRLPNQKTIFQHQEDLESFSSLGIVGAEKSVLIRGSGIDPSVFRPHPEPGGVPIVLMPSRMLAVKGVPDLVEASRLLRQRRVPFRIILAGEPDPGNPTSIPESQLREWNREGAVEWAGHVKDMVRAYSAAHIVVLPSHAEGVPRALIEAAAMGKPIVATDLPGCREVVYNGRNGLLVPVRDPLALSQAIQTLAEDPELRRHMGAEGRKIALENFTDEIINGMILAVYDEVLAGAGRDRITPVPA